MRHVLGSRVLHLDMLHSLSDTVVEGTAPIVIASFFRGSGETHHQAWNFGLALWKNTPITGSADVEDANILIF